MDSFPHIPIIEAMPSFSEILNYTCKHVPQRIFLIERKNFWSYEKFNKLVNQCSYYFEHIGLRPDDVISVILRNSIDYLILYFAAIRSRIILNPFPFHLSSNEVLSKVEIIKPKVIFCHKTHFRTLSHSNYKVKNLDNTDGKVFLEILNDYSEIPFKSVEIRDNQIAIMYYSSGTTGNSKIIEYTYKNMVLSQASMLQSGFTKPGDVHLCVLPLGHTASLRYTIKQCVCTGSTVVLYESFWKLRPKLWDEIEKYKATFMQVVPSILITILNTPYKNMRREQTASMDFIGCGSSFLAKNIQESFEKKFGIPVANLYGMSETGATHFDDPREPGRKTGNIGKPFDIIDIKIFNDDGREVKQGEVGEFGIRGLGLFKGYYKNRKLFKGCFKNGYFMTGDLGRVDESGIYYYSGRKKDLIIKGGVNIEPARIDEVLHEYPHVAEAATIGKPDILLGEVVKSYVVLKKGVSVTPEELKDFCKEKLGDFMCPSEFEFVENIPKGPSGKILKRELRQIESSKHRKNRMSKIAKKILIYGAGAIGRGFLGPLLQKYNMELSFVDINPRIINEMKKRKTYKAVVIKGSNYEIIDIPIKNAFMLGEEKNIEDYDLVFCSVGPNNCYDLAERFKKARAVILCENDSKCPVRLRELSNNQNIYFGIPDVITSNTASSDLQKLDSLITITEQGTLDIEKGNYLLPAEISQLDMNELNMRWRCKLFIHNASHAIVAYLGWLKGYTYIHEAMADPDIEVVVLGAINEITDGLIATNYVRREYAIMYKEKELKRFRNKLLFDTIERVAREPIRKLGRDNRIILGMRVALFNGKVPKYTAIGAKAALAYDNPNDKEAMYLQNLRNSKSDIEVLREYSGIEILDPLGHFIVSQDLSKFLGGRRK